MILEEYLYDFQIMAIVRKIKSFFERLYTKGVDLETKRTLLSKRCTTRFEGLLVASGDSLVTTFFSRSKTSSFAGDPITSMK